MIYRNYPLRMQVQPRCRLCAEPVAPNARYRDAGDDGVAHEDCADEQSEALARVEKPKPQ